MDHALPAEVVSLLDELALSLAQLAQADVLPSPWYAEVTVLHDRLLAMTERHVYRGA